MRCSLLLMIAIAGPALVPARGQAADGPPTDAVLIEGLVALVGGSAADETETEPVLHGQVMATAVLVDLLRAGPLAIERDTDPTALPAARRTAILVALLARQSRLTGELVSPAELDTAVGELERRAGGAAALDRLLARRGLGRGSFTAWLGSVLLAAIQLRYQEEILENPTASALREALGPWLTELMGRNHVRSVR